MTDNSGRMETRTGKTDNSECRETRIGKMDNSGCRETRTGKMDNSERRDREMAYIADESVFAEMVECKKKLKVLGSLDPWEYDRIAAAAKEVIPDSGSLQIIPPFYCEYGTHITLGENFFANYGCIMIDVARITIGKNCLLGPSVSIYTAGHPIHPKTRASGYEYGKSVTIGDEVWIGGASVILPGVRIGSGTVIGAGSVVTRDIPARVLAAGNPCRVIRAITEEDRRKLFRDEDIDEEAWERIANL